MVLVAKDIAWTWNLISLNFSRNSTRCSSITMAFLIFLNRHFNESNIGSRLAHGTEEKS